METIDDGWREMAERVLHPNAGEVQRMEMRRAFYAGANTMLALIVLAVDGGEVAAETRIEALHAEIKQFAIDIAKGRA